MQSKRLRLRYEWYDNFSCKIFVYHIKGQQSKCGALNKIFAYFQDKNAIEKAEIKASMV